MRDRSVTEKDFKATMEWLAMFQAHKLTPEDICHKAKEEYPQITPTIVKAAIFKASEMIGVQLRPEAEEWLDEAREFLQGE